MTLFRGRPSPLFRSVLALLLVCAQVLAAAHAVGHIGGKADTGQEWASTSQPADRGLPAAERHERCLLCLAAADLAAALPPSLPVLGHADVQYLISGDGLHSLPAFRLPRPHSRGPPASPV